MSASATNGNFRTALHGFNREDVVTFIESTALEQEKEKRLLRDSNARLQSELEEARTALAAAADTASREELVQAQQLAAVLSAENDSLREQLAQLRNELARDNAERPQQPAAANPLTAPMPTIAELMPAQPASAQNYSELELAAYRRAEVAERLARERASKVYEQINAVFAGASARFESSESDLDQLCKTLRMNVEQLLQILNGIRCAYTETEQSFHAVGDKNREQAEALD